MGTERGLYSTNSIIHYRYKSYPLTGLDSAPGDWVSQNF